MDDQLVAKGSLACEMEVAVALARALREQQTLLQSTDIGVAFIQKRAIQRCNQQFAEIFGFPDSASLLGQASYLLHPSRDAFRALGRDAFAEMAQGRTFRSVRQMRRKDGSLFWASLTGRFINSEAPSEGSIWTLDDVDAQILMRSKLDAIQLQTQILLDHAMVGVVYVREHKVVQCNRHAEQMLGYAPGQLCGQAARDWFASDSDWAAQLADYAPTLAMGKVFSAELNLRRQDGAELICETRSKALDDGSTVWIFMDITERRQTQEALRQAHAELKRVVSERTHALVNTTKNLDKEIQERKYDREHIYWLAHYDPLTGLPNRSLLAERSQQAIAQAQCSNTPLAVLFLDLDHFKHINDSLGHKVGDSLLTHIAKRLSQTVREYDTVARLGGDEFVLLLPRANAAGAQRVAGKVAQAFNAPFQVGPHELTLGCSVGVALYPQDGRDFDALVQSADMAMYGAKRQGRNTYRFFTSQMQAQSMRALELENALRRALERVHDLLMGVRARLRAVCVVANPRNSQAIAVVCASQPIPNRSPHTFIRDHEHVLRTRATNALTHLATIQRGHANRQPAQHQAGAAPGHQGAQGFHPGEDAQINQPTEQQHPQGEQQGGQVQPATAPLPRPNAQGQQHDGMQQLLLHRLLQSGAGGFSCYRVGDKAQAVAGVSGQADTGAAQHGGGDEQPTGSIGKKAIADMHSRGIFLIQAFAESHFLLGTAGVSNRLYRAKR